MNYLRDVLNNFFKTKSRLKIDFKTVLNQKFLSNLIMNDDKTMVNLNKIVQLFPNTNSMRLIHTKLFVFCKQS